MFLCFIQIFHVQLNDSHVCQKLLPWNFPVFELTFDKLNKNWNEPDEIRKKQGKIEKISKNYGNAQKSLSTIAMLSSCDLPASRI